MDLSTIAGNVVNRLVGSLDFDPDTPGIFDPYTGPSLPDLIGGVAETYLERELAGAPAQQLPPLPPDWAGDIPGQTSTTNGGAMPQFTDAAGRTWRCGPSRRRRRRRMLTPTDLKDIAAAKAVLGQGKAFEQWLAKATHSR